MVEGTTLVFSPSMLLVLDKLFRLTLITNNYRFWHVIPTGGNLFEVRSKSEGFTVDEGKRTCSCRMWQLSGIPHVHATKVIFLINRIPKSYVPAWFETNMYFVTYHNYDKLVPSMNFWPDRSMYSTVLPPNLGKCLVGQERKESELCCKEPLVEQTPKPKEVPGRPRKNQSVDDLDDVDVVLRGQVRNEGASGSRGGTSESRGRGGDGGSRGGASGSRGRGDAGSKRKLVSSVGTQKGKTQHEPVQTQDEDQVEQTEEQAEIDLTQVEQTQEQTREQV
ncbi:multidrug resistance-associated protein 5 [Tanacetum coccineum]